MATVLAVVAALLFVLALFVLGTWYFVDNVPDEDRNAQLKFVFQTVGVCLLLFVVGSLIN